MAAWLDIAIVTLALLLAGALALRIYQRGKACAKTCGACGPANEKSELVQIRRKDRPFLADSRSNR